MNYRVENDIRIVRHGLAEPFLDQHPGMSGLRKRTQEFECRDYLESFIQSIFDIMPTRESGVLVVGGDGRYFARPAAERVIRMAAANGFQRIVAGRDALLSTPAAANLVKRRRADGAVLLTASHNLGGPDGDFGVKFNTSNGAPAPASVTSDIYERSRVLREYVILSDACPALSKVGETRIGPMTLEVVDPVSEYQETMERLFDFDLRRQWAIVSMNFA